MVNITMLIISTIWFTLDLSVSSVLRPYLHMLGSSSLTRVFRVCKTGLHPLYLNIELITLVITWCLSMKNFRNGAYSGRTLIPWNFSKGSSYNATAVSKIRCIKDKHHMQSKYVTWYGHHHLVLLITAFKASSWSPSSPAQHLDLHHCVGVVSPTIANA